MTGSTSVPELRRQHFQVLCLAGHGTAGYLAGLNAIDADFRGLLDIDDVLTDFMGNGILLFHSGGDLGAHVVDGSYGIGNRIQGGDCFLAALDTVVGLDAAFVHNINSPGGAAL